MSNAPVPRLRDFVDRVANHDRRIRRLEVNHTIITTGGAAYSYSTGASTPASSWVVDEYVPSLALGEYGVDTIGLTIGSDIGIPAGWLWWATLYLEVAVTAAPTAGDALYWTVQADGVTEDAVTVPMFETTGVWSGIIASHLFGSSGPSGGTIGPQTIASILGSDFLLGALQLYVTGIQLPDIEIPPTVGGFE